MTLDGIIDTTVLIHLFRGSASAMAWLSSQRMLGVTSITQLEFIYGSRGKHALRAAVKLLNSFAPVSLTAADQTWAIETMKRLRLNQGIQINDTLIASVCSRLQIPIFTHNVKDMSKLLPYALVIEPYKVSRSLAEASGLIPPTPSRGKGLGRWHFPSPLDARKGRVRGVLPWSVYELDNKD